MTAKNHTQATQQTSKRNPALSRLDALVGEWEIEASIEGQPVARSKTKFEWLEGGAFLVQHIRAEPPLPNTPPEWVANAPQEGTTIMGLDDATETFYMLYADSRGVSRVYQMSLSDGVWKIWRDAPGFNQRFTGAFSDDGNTINSQWEFSKDGANWEIDFNFTYKKIT